MLIVLNVLVLDVLVRVQLDCEVKGYPNTLIY